MTAVNRQAVLSLFRSSFVNVYFERQHIANLKDLFVQYSNNFRVMSNGRKADSHVR